MIPTTSIPNPATTDFAGAAKSVAVSGTSDSSSSPTAENEFSQEMENALTAEMGLGVEGFVETEELLSQTPANADASDLATLDALQVVQPSATPSAPIAHAPTDLSAAVSAAQTSESSLGMSVGPTNAAKLGESVGSSNVLAESIEGIVPVESAANIVSAEQPQGISEVPSVSEELSQTVGAEVREVGTSNALASNVPASNTPSSMKLPADDLTNPESSPNIASTVSEPQAEETDVARTTNSVGEPLQSTNQGVDSELQNELNTQTGDGTQKPATSTPNAGAEDLQSVLRDVPTDNSVAVTNPATVSNASDAPVTRTITDTATVTNQVADHVISAKQSIRDGGAQLELTLDPPELGRITIQLVERDSVVEARLTVSESTTIELIRESMPKLVDSLSESGILMGDFHLENAPRNQRDATTADGRRLLESDVEPGEGNSHAAPERLISRPGSIDILVQ